MNHLMKIGLLQYARRRKSYDPKNILYVDRKKTVVLIFFIGNKNVQYMNFPKKRKDKKERKLNLITS